MMYHILIIKLLILFYGIKGSLGIIVLKCVTYLFRLLTLQIYFIIIEFITSNVKKI